MTETQRSEVAQFLDSVALVGAEHDDGVIRREDVDGEEAWIRVTDEPDILLVEAIRNEDAPGWQVGVAVMEFVREGDSPYLDLERAIGRAIADVAGVRGFHREDNEVWWVTGAPSGEELVLAVASVLDDRADDLRAFYNDLPDGSE